MHFTAVNKGIYITITHKYTHFESGADNSFQYWEAFRSGFEEHTKIGNVLSQCSVKSGGKHAFLFLVYLRLYKSKLFFTQVNENSKKYRKFTADNVTSWGGGRPDGPQ